MHATGAGDQISPAPLDTALPQAAQKISPEAPRPCRERNAPRGSTPLPAVARCPYPPLPTVG